MNETITPDIPVRSSFTLLDVRVDAVQIPDVIAVMQDWIARRDVCRYVAVTGMHGITEAQHDQKFNQVLNAAGLLVPDGYPLVWIGRRRGLSHLKRRVYGPELMTSFFELTANCGYRHFFYGGAPGVAEDLASRFASRYRGMIAVGTYCPPYRYLTPEEDEAVVDRIEESRADVVWVGLSTPKQERWMFEHRARLHVPVLVGVGAAFDFHTQRLAQAPEWMRENGLEWCFRLMREPKRLWRRYLLNGPEFVYLAALESVRLRLLRGKS